MTLVDNTFLYGASQKEDTWRAIDAVRDVYGIHALSFDDKTHTIHVEYDASRLTQGDVAALLRDAGVEVRAKTWEA